MHADQISRGDGTNKHPCWITEKEDDVHANPAHKDFPKQFQRRNYDYQR